MDKKVKTMPIDNYVTLVTEFRDLGVKANSRGEFNGYVYALHKALKKIGRNELSEQLWNLYCEMEDMDLNGEDYKKMHKLFYKE